MIQLLFWQFLHQSSTIQHQNAVTELVNHCQIMRNEKQCEVPFFAKLLKEVENLSLNGDIKRRDGFIGHQHFWISSKRSGNGDSLSLPPTELMGILIQRIGGQSNFIKKLVEFRSRCRF